MSDANEVKLLPCPFCGSAARWAVSTESDDSEIQCSNAECALLVFGQKDSDQETAAAWNMRIDPLRQQIVAALHAVCRAFSEPKATLEQERAAIKEAYGLARTALADIGGEK